ncbi:MAG: hypothetical protein Q7S17_05190 [Xanthobacteraceae bacterium]|nr:hypothetical protein [Xanthobacteraceae bacterium]
MADKHYVVGETYWMVPHEERSTASHAHYFAAVNEAWQNLSDEQALRFPTAEHLRKWALIEAGYRDERSIVASSKAEAQRLAAFIKPMDEYAVVTVTDAVVRAYTAQSQSYRAMNRKTFQESKDKVLAVVAGLIGVTADELRRNADPGRTLAAG